MRIYLAPCPAQKPKTNAGPSGYSFHARNKNNVACAAVTTLGSITCGGVTSCRIPMWALIFVGNSSSMRVCPILVSCFVPSDIPLACLLFNIEILTTESHIHIFCTFYWYPSYHRIQNTRLITGDLQYEKSI